MMKRTMVKRLIALAAVVSVALVCDNPKISYSSNELRHSLDSEPYGLESKTVNKGKLDCKLTIHSHVKECYDSERNIICGYADFVVHTHNRMCYDETGGLVCTLEEIKTHTHNESCYGTLEDLMPSTTDAETTGQNEIEYSNETDDLEEFEMEEIGDMVIIIDEPVPIDDRNRSGKGNVLTCGKTQIQLHRHTKDCYDSEGKLICGKLEVLCHLHTSACFSK